MLIKTNDRPVAGDLVPRRGPEGGSVAPPAPSQPPPPPRADLVTLSFAARRQAAALSRDLVRLLATEPTFGHEERTAPRAPATMAGVQLPLAPTPMAGVQLPRAPTPMAGVQLPLAPTPMAGVQLPLAPATMPEGAPEAAGSVEETGRPSLLPESAPLAVSSQDAPRTPGSARSATGWATLLQRLFRAADPYAGARASLTRALPDSRRPAFDALVPGDRALLADVYDLAAARGVALDEVDGLALALGRHRLGTLDVVEHVNDAEALPVAFGLRFVVAPPPEHAEQAARSILSLMAMRDTRIDHGFVAAVLHPSRLVAPRVELGLLRQVVQASSPRYASGTRDLTVSFAARDGLIALARDVRSRATTLLAALHTPPLADASAERSAPEVRHDDASADVPVVDVRHGERLLRLEALPAADRAVVEHLYAHADGGRIDVREVDRLADELRVLREGEAAIASPHQALPAREQLALERVQSAHGSDEAAHVATREEDALVAHAALPESGEPCTSALLSVAHVSHGDARDRRRSRRRLRRWALRIQRKRRSHSAACSTQMGRRSR